MSELQEPIRIAENQEFIVSDSILCYWAYENPERQERPVIHVRSVVTNPVPYAVSEAVGTDGVDPNSKYLPRTVGSRRQIITALSNFP